MKVRAISTGFYGGARRREGEVFDAKDGATAKWFEPLEPVDPKPAKGSKAKADKVEAKAEAEAADLA